MSSVRHLFHSSQWPDLLPTIGLLCLFFAFVHFVKHSTNQRSFPRLLLPPGPKPVPILGNAHQFPYYMQHEGLAEWAKQYGDVLHARVFRQHIIVLSSPEAARALMEKRGAIYSGRPRFAFLCELCGLDSNLAFMQDPGQTRRHRKWFQYSFQVKSRLDTYSPMQVKVVNQMLADILRDPDSFYTHIKRLAAALMLELGYAHTLGSDSEEFISRTSAVIHGMFNAGNPGAMLVDCVPILGYLPSWMPGASFKRRAYELRPRLEAVIRSPFRAVMLEAADGTAKPSFATALLDEAQPGQALPEAEEKHMSGAVNSLYIAGTDTTTAVLGAFVLAMTLNPHVFEKAQSEMDRVVGRDRLPEIADRPELPYLECVLKEVYRWGVPVPLGVAHELTEDDEYNGYFMPKGSTVFANIWAMTRDENVYDHACDFIPERFMNLDDAQLHATDPSRLVFGFGRRLCPGRFLGDTSNWLAMANMIAALDIRKKRDAQGVEITPPLAFSSGIVRRPESFVCDIRPRSDKAAALISHNSVLYDQ